MSARRSATSWPRSPGTYYARVAGSGAPYSLIVTKNAGFRHRAERFCHDASVGNRRHPGVSLGSWGRRPTRTRFKPANISADLTGTASLIKTGAGTAVLSGNNTYTGDTVVASGQLVIDSDGALPEGTSLCVGADASVVLGSNLKKAVSFASPHARGGPKHARRCSTGGRGSGR